MNIIRDLNELSKPLTNPVLTIGNFDGVHRGHLALFDKIKRRAAKIDGQSAVMTFEPHPIKVVKPGNGPPLITPIDQKLKLISDAEIDVILCLPFTLEFAAIPAGDWPANRIRRHVSLYDGEDNNLQRHQIACHGNLEFTNRRIESDQGIRL